MVFLISVWFGLWMMMLFVDRLFLIMNLLVWLLCLFSMIGWWCSLLFFMI